MRCLPFLTTLVLAGACAGSHAQTADDSNTMPSATRAHRVAHAGQVFQASARPSLTLTRTAGAPLWSRRYGGTGSDEAAAAAFDPHDNLVLGGQFSGRVAFGRDTLRSQGPSDAFVAKLSPSGALLWTRALGGPGRDQVTAVAVDPGGTIVVVGSFEGQLVFAGRTLHSRGPQDVFVATYSADGAERWATSLGSPRWAVAESAAVDLSGDVLIAGTFAGSLRAGERVHEAGGEASGFVVRIDPDGRVIWSMRIGSGGWNEATALAVDEDGGAFVAGALSGAPRDHGFVSRIADQGDILWTRRLDGDARVLSAAAAPHGGVLVAGAFTGVVDMGGQTLTSAGERDVFIASYDGGGHLLWTRRFGGARNDGARSIAVSPRGDLIVAGAVSGDVTLGGEILHAGHLDVFVARFTAHGEHRWSRCLPGPGAGTRAVAAAASGWIALAGSFAHTLDPGPGHALESAGGLDAFVVAFSPTLPPPEPRR